MTKRITCDRCGKRVHVRGDDTIIEHHWTRRGVKYRCDASETTYARHAGTFRCVGPAGNRRWVAECRCGESWSGPATEDYDTVERQWREHCEAVATA